VLAAWLAVVLAGALVALGTDSSTAETGTSAARPANPRPGAAVGTAGGTPLGTAGDSAAGRYIVRYKAGRSGPATASAARAAGAAQPAGSAQAAGSGHAVTFRSAFRGFAGRLSAADVARLRADPAVASVTADGIATAQESEWFPTWGLDRIDQPDLPLDGTYSYDGGPADTGETGTDTGRTGTDAGAGAGVRVFVLDTGLNSSHVEFTGRVSPGRNFTDHVVAGTDPWPYDPPVDPRDTRDCAGHGTHVAGTAAGARYGVAKAATVVPVRVLNCEGWAYWSQVLSGIDWIVAQQEDHPGQVAVANMSLSGEAFPLLDDAVAAAVAHGVVFVVAAGNRFSDACAFSPGRTPSAITVGATDPADRVTDFSNYGACVDLYAPGENIISAGITGPESVATMSGTSMASPHAAGVAATLRAAYPTEGPAQIADRLFAMARPGALTGVRADIGDPNLLLQTLPAPRTPDVTAPSVAGVQARVTRCTTTVVVRASDTGAGVSGVSFVYDRSPASGSVDATVDSPTLTLTRQLPTGTWYVHLRVVDGFGNATVPLAATLHPDCTAPLAARPLVTRRSNTLYAIIPRGVDAGAGYAGSTVVLNGSATSAAGTRRWVAAGSTLTWRAPRRGLWYVHVQAQDWYDNASGWIRAGGYRVR